MIHMHIHTVAVRYAYKMFSQYLKLRGKNSEEHENNFQLFYRELIHLNTTNILICHWINNL